MYTKKISFGEKCFRINTSECCDKASALGLRLDPLTLERAWNFFDLNV